MNEIVKNNKELLNFEEQVNEDQLKYSRYVCDSRAIPNEIDGLKPVQRRILWAMWNSNAKNQFTKTVKVAGLAMGYHPHGDKSIQDALSQMAQDFTFSNNYPLVSGEGTFGDVLDPNAIASPRYTEVKISNFTKDIGFFESLEDIDYVDNYDETDKEPVHFVGKIPVVLLNHIQGIATGFRCFIPGHNISDIIQAQISYLQKKKIKDLHPWYIDYKGKVKIIKNSSTSFIMSTSFAYEWREDKIFLINAPMNWNREKVILYLEDILDKKNSWLKDYIDYSSQVFNIELIYKKNEKPTNTMIEELFFKEENQSLAMNVISYEGKLNNFSSKMIIKRFCDYRKNHLIKKFKRLSVLENEKIEKNQELIRFIQEKWNEKVINMKSKGELEKKLKEIKFKYYEWLSTIPIYRMTLEEVNKCLESIKEASRKFKEYTNLYEQDNKLKNFMIDELKDLNLKWK